MGFADLYLSKQKGFKPCFGEPPSPGLRCAVVIPAYREPHVIRTLECLYACARPAFHAEVIVVPNRPASADPETVEQSRQMTVAASAWAEAHQDPAFRFLVMPEQVFPDRDAGVGLARKTGMDQALARFNILDVSGGMILCLDADCLCEPSYFTALEATLAAYPRTRGVNIRFEHPLQGDEYPESQYRAIAGYELHLRVMNRFIRFTGFPYAYHTVGSCFGVRAETYAREGGMNKRKAGEDFYFLQKIIPLGEFREINTTCVVPSPRISDRVPFGTGAAQSRLMASGNETVLTYHPEGYVALKALFDRIPAVYAAPDGMAALRIQELPAAVASFLEEADFTRAFEEIRANAASPAAFVSRFYRWFNAFRIVKYLNHASRRYYDQTEVMVAAAAFLHIAGITLHPPDTPAGMLELFRKLEREM